MLVKNSLILTSMFFVVSCSSVSKDNKAPNIRANTLSSTDFKEKVSNGGSIYKGMDDLRGKFANKSMSLTGSSFLTNEEEFDLDSSNCKLEGTEVVGTGESATTVSTYSCVVTRNGADVNCKVIRVVDSKGTEIGVNSQCSDASNPSNPQNPTDNQNPAKPSQESEAGNYIPSTSEINDCASGFDLFDSLYAQSKADYESMAASFKDPAANSVQYAKLTTTTPAADEAAAYIIEPKDQMNGLVVSGRIAGGGNENNIVLRSSFDMVMDLDKMFQQSNSNFPFPTGDMEMPGSGNPQGQSMGKQAIKADKLIEMDLAAKVAKSTVTINSSQTTGDQISTQSVSGTVVVSNGAEKFVAQDMSISMNGIASSKFDVKMTARLLNENTISIEGNFVGAGAPGPVNLTITRKVDGTCIAQNNAK
jgi:hypothetical protein